MKRVAISFVVLTLVTVFYTTCYAHPHRAKQGKSYLLTFKYGLPLKGHIYIQEIEDLIERGIIAKYGREEFEASILTHELHGHIGVYTLIGTKMGLYAMGLLSAPRRKMKIVSECGGGKYPLKCINDGIVVSTLCSPIYGKLEIDSSKSNYAAAFSYGDKTVRLELKQSYRSQLEARIDDAVKKYKKEGKFTPPYWEQVRKMTWWAWEEWDRKIIFDVQWIRR